MAGRNPYEGENARKIESRMEWLRQVAKERAEKSMCSTLRAAMDYALALHDAEHSHHIFNGDSYGWILVHNGDVVDLEVNASYDNIGHAERMLREVGIGNSGSGYTGIVMASMLNDYYKIDFEIDVLTESVEYTKEAFPRLFKQIDV